MFQAIKLQSPYKEEYESYVARISAQLIKCSNEGIFPYNTVKSPFLFDGGTMYEVVNLNDILNLQPYDACKNDFESGVLGPLYLCRNSDEYYAWLLNKLSERSCYLVRLDTQSRLFLTLFTKTDLILNSWGWTLESRPQPGDLAVFKLKNNYIADHFARVKRVYEDGDVLLHSKWGINLNAFDHLLSETPADKPCDVLYYRLSQQSSLFHILPSVIMALSMFCLAQLSKNN